jgi:hypothetical protein
VLLPVFLAVAFFQASDVIRGMGSAAVAQALPEAPRFSRRGLWRRPDGIRHAAGGPQSVAWRRQVLQRYQTLIDAEVRLDGRKLYGYDRFNAAALQAFFEQRRAFFLQ